MRPHILSDEAHRIALGFSPPDDRYFAARLRDGLGERGRTPLRSRTERQQRARQAADQVGFRTGRSEGKVNAARGLDHTGGDFQEPKTQRRELGSGQFPDFGNGVPHGQHQFISGRMEHETDLVGERRTTTGAIGGELRLMQLDQILGLAARAIQAVVDPAKRELSSLLKATPSALPAGTIPRARRASMRLLDCRYTDYQQLFNARQLLHLASLGREISLLDEKVRKALAFAFSDHLTTNNMMCAYAGGWRRLTPLFSIRAISAYRAAGRAESLV